MTLGGANVWSDFSYGIDCDAPGGWLLSPKSSRIIYFQRDKKSLRKNIKIILLHYYSNEKGQPIKLKTSERLSIEDSWRRWHRLLIEGWSDISQNLYESS
tara:strand:- start:345 stop:644 length:300 start_codon:yes stop_codon:yes gene_type:complete